MKQLLAILLVLFLVGCGGVSEAPEAEEMSEPAESNNEPEEMQESDDEASDSEEEMEESNSMSLREALKFSGSMKCTVKGYQDGVSVDGTYWIKNDKHATDFQLDNERLYTIFDGETMYSWGHSMLTEGQKFKLEDIEKLAESAGVDLKTPDQQAEEYDGLEPDCVEQDVPNSKFNPPSDVTFNDLGEQLAQLDDMLANLPEGFEMPN